jgi:hypothetical protein
MLENHVLLIFFLVYSVIDPSLFSIITRVVLPDVIYPLRYRIFLATKKAALIYLENRMAMYLVLS